jgi:cytochrome c oxidase cbb3-type subunit 3
LDHDYDGIRELDNALPPWWKYGFYVTIVVAVIYLLRFHMWGTGPSPEQEYATEMEKAQIQIQEYMAKAKDLVDENNVSLADASGISAGNALYQKTCVACHGQKGEGGVGPNLTDDYWIHGGSMNDIFKTIKYGFPDKGMQSWQAQFSPKQIQQISSFVKSLHGTNPSNPKAPQGDLYQEGGKEQPATDSIGAPKKEEKAVAVNG